MTAEQKIIKTKVGLLELAKQLGNVSRACRGGGSDREGAFRWSRSCLLLCIFATTFGYEAS